MDDCTWPNPLNDYEQAMTLIRSHADTWHIYEDKIAVIGFSAGGHLATAAATLAQNRPNAAILGYAVTSQHVQACNPNGTGDHLRCRPENTTLLRLCNTHRQHGSDQQFH